MSNSAYRWLRTAVAALAAGLVVLATAGTASARSSDNQPPSAPTNVTITHFPDLFLTTIDWDASTDDTDAPEDLTYVFESDDPIEPRREIEGGSTEYTGSFLPNVVTVWAVDSSGNESEKVTVRRS